jgi:heme oxygenase (mycobilin-producing)
LSVVKINAIHVPEGAGPELEARFAARKHAVDGQPGFEAWRDGPAKEAHQGAGRRPVATGADLLEFEVVDLP